MIFLSLLLSFVLMAVILAIRFPLHNWQQGLKQTEREAVWEIQHIMFGVGLASFFGVFFDKWYSFLFALISILIWEIYEEVRHGICSENPIDTILDLIAGLGFAALYLCLFVL